MFDDKFENVPACLQIFLIHLCENYLENEFQNSMWHTLICFKNITELLFL